MAHFVFKAKKSTGEVYENQLDAADRYELYQMIHATGDELLSAQQRSAKKGGSLGSMSIFQHIGMADKINFARNLGSMLGAGLALSRALSVLERQARTPVLKTVIQELSLSISKGMTFSDALAQHPKVFSNLLVSMVHAGEQGGSLSDTLKIVSFQMENAYLLTKRIRGALIYPTVIICLMIVIAILMFVFVIPTLIKTFTELHVQLPWTTQLLLDISNLIRNQGLWVLIGAIIAGFGIYKFVRNATGKSIIDTLILKIPIIGPLVQEVNAARTARTLSSLLESGVEVVESMNITAGVLQNVHFKKVMMKAAEAVSKGELMSKVFAQYSKLYPVFLVEMISVGEESGKTSDMLMGVAKYYEDDVDQKTKDMSTVIEPFIMIGIAAGVGFFAVAMISPMYSLVNAI